MSIQKFTYQECEIDFIPDSKNELMINATQMAKAFDKRVDVFMKSDHAKTFISILEQTPNGGRSDQKIVDNRGHMGIWFERRLALKFAAWLNPEFEVWVYNTIDQILFGDYIRWKEAEKEKMRKKQQIESKRQQLLDQYPDLKDLFEMETEFRQFGKESNAALRAAKIQLRLDFN